METKDEVNDARTQEKEEVDSVNKLETENKRMEEALKKKEELLKRNEELLSRDRVSGRSEAGKPQKTEKDLDNEKIEEQADRIYGSLYDLKKRKR